MKNAERIIGGVVLLGLVLKLFTIPGGSTLLIISTAILSLFYFACSFFIFKPASGANDIDEHYNSMKVLGSIATGMSLSTTLIGILFKIMHWPGAAAQIIIGLVCLCIIGLISIFKFSTTKSGYYKRIGIRIGIVGLAGLIFFFG